MIHYKSNISLVHLHVLHALANYQAANNLHYLFNQNILYRIYNDNDNNTGWPRKNATTLIINFKDIINKTIDFYFIMWKIHFPIKWHHDH